MATYRTFVRGKEKYSLSGKKQLRELISKDRQKCDKELKGTGRKDKILPQTEKTCTNNTKTRFYCCWCKGVVY